MLIPISLLRKYIPDLMLSSKEISDCLTSIGLEVSYINEINPQFSNVVSATIIEASPHTNSNKLTVATVFDGTETFQVVCGAQNCRASINVAYAKIGAILPLKNGTLKIEERALRGITSFGMLCSLDELALSSKEESGIAELPSDFPLGVDLSQFYQDTILEIGLTPNLAHCASVLGIVRELANMLGLNFSEKLLLDNTINVSEDTYPLIKIKKNPLICSHYSYRTIHGIKNIDTPFDIANNLMKLGVSVSNNAIVDVTNYVMMFIGQPLHAFSIDNKSIQAISVDSSKGGETFTTLNGKEYSLNSQVPLIIFNDEIEALGGIMGGNNSKVTESTSSILLEAAVFNKELVQKASRNLGLSTDASYRFSRGIDPLAVNLALDIACNLITKITGGYVSSSYIEEATYSHNHLDIRTSFLNKILGTNCSSQEIETQLAKFNFKTKSISNNNTLNIEIPSYRHDISYEVDLVEEYIRAVGFNSILKQGSESLFRNGNHSDSPSYTINSKIRENLIKQGLQECICCPLIGSNDALTSINLFQGEAVSLKDKSSSDLSLMRTSLLFPLLKTVRYNLNRNTKNFQGFEIGKVFFINEQQSFVEQFNIGIILTGSRTIEFWNNDQQHNVDFFDLKGIVEQLISNKIKQEFIFEPNDNKNYHPNKQCKISCGEKIIGYLGELNISLLSENGIKQPVFYSELSVEAINSLSPSNNTKVSPAHVFPGSNRDWTICLNKNILANSVVSYILSTRSDLLENVSIVSVYQNDSMGSDWRNVTLRFFYRNNSKTISGAEIEQEHSRIINYVWDILNKDGSVKETV